MRYSNEVPPTKRKRKPRTSRFGSIRELPSGNQQATYWHNGKQHAKTFKYVADASAWLSSVQTDLGRGLRVNTRAGLVPFGEFAERWYKRRCQAVIKPLAQTTAAKYRHLLDAFILPEFEVHKLAQINSDQVQDWWDRIAREHRSTASDAYRLLSTIFNAAIKVDKIISHSPCEIEGAGASPVAQRPTATDDNIQAAINAAPDRYRVAFLLASWCALRRGEVLGLQRQDVDLADSAVTIQRAWVAVPGGKPVLKTPKSEAGARKVYMPPKVAEAMETHLERFVGPAADAWLFGTSTGTTISPRNLSRAWNKAREKAGRDDLHFHDLRHTGLTWVAQTGATQAEIQRHAGHASPAAAARYQHAEDERMKSIATRLGQMAAQPASENPDLEQLVEVASNGGD